MVRVINMVVANKLLEVEEEDLGKMTNMVEETKEVDMDSKVEVAMARAARKNDESTMESGENITEKEDTRRVVMAEVISTAEETRKAAMGSKEEVMAKKRVVVAMVMKAARKAGENTTTVEDMKRKATVGAIKLEDMDRNKADMARGVQHLQGTVEVALKKATEVVLNKVTEVVLNKVMEEVLSKRTEVAAAMVAEVGGMIITLVTRCVMHSNTAATVTTKGECLAKP